MMDVHLAHVIVASVAAIGGIYRQNRGKFAKNASIGLKNVNKSPLTQGIAANRKTLTHYFVFIGL